MEEYPPLQLCQPRNCGDYCNCDPCRAVVCSPCVYGAAVSKSKNGTAGEVNWYDCSGWKWKLLFTILPPCVIVGGGYLRYKAEQDWLGIFCAELMCPLCWCPPCQADQYIHGKKTTKNNFAYATMSELP